VRIAQRMTVLILTLAVAGCGANATPTPAPTPVPTVDPTASPVSTETPSPIPAPTTTETPSATPFVAKLTRMPFLEALWKYERHEPGALDAYHKPITAAEVRTALAGVLATTATGFISDPLDWLKREVADCLTARASWDTHTPGYTQAVAGCSFATNYAFVMTEHTNDPAAITFAVSLERWGATVVCEMYNGCGNLVGIVFSLREEP
jgi:hypothetical protein